MLKNIRTFENVKKKYPNIFSSDLSRERGGKINLSNTTYIFRTFIKLFRNINFISDSEWMNRMWCRMTVWLCEVQTAYCNDCSTGLSDSRLLGWAYWLLSRLTRTHCTLHCSCRLDKTTCEVRGTLYHQKICIFI